MRMRIKQQAPVGNLLLLKYGFSEDRYNLHVSFAAVALNEACRGSYHAEQNVIPLLV